MKIKTHNRKRKQAHITALVILVLIIVGGMTYAYATKMGPFSYLQKEKGQLTEDQNKQNIPTEKEQNPTSSPDKKPNQFEEQPASAAEDEDRQLKFTGIINYKAVKDDALVIRSTINTSIDSGTCDLILTHTLSGKKVTKESAVIANPSSSTCEGFDVPLSELSSGTWNIVIKIDSRDVKGNLEDTITI